MEKQHSETNEDEHSGNGYEGTSNCDVVVLDCDIDFDSEHGGDREKAVSKASAPRRGARRVRKSIDEIV